MSLEYKFESLKGGFPRDLTRSRSSSPFSMTWAKMQDLLERELRFLNYRRGTVILQTAHSPRDVRKDGQLRSDVRKPEHPGVVVRFNVYDSKSKQIVQMSFECDQFSDWKSNVRAIADAMEALRKVNRYGVSSGGKTEAHYEGFKALPPAAENKSAIDVAADFISAYSEFSRTEVLVNVLMMTQGYRKAAQKLHPDGGGNHEKFVELQKAKEILEKHFSNK